MWFVGYGISGPNVNCISLGDWSPKLLGFVNFAQSNVWPASVGVIAYVGVVVEEEAGVGFPDSE